MTPRVRGLRFRLSCVTFCVASLVFAFRFVSFSTAQEKPGDTAGPLPEAAFVTSHPAEPGGLSIPLPPGIPPADPAYRGSPELSWYYMVDARDADGDGLSDYEEKNKYLTDPLSADSDGDGIHDGEPDERREYTYSIEAVRELSVWYHPEAMNDTFQDIEVVSERDGVLRYRVILYPYAADVPEGDPLWKRNGENPAFARLLAPGRTVNFDDGMRREILKSIPPGLATDLELVRFLVPEFFARRTGPPAHSGNDPIDLRIDLRGDDAFVPPASVGIFREKSSRSDPDLSDQDFLYDLLFAKRMFDKKLDGACTESATYMAAVLRAAGIPARGIETNALLDHSDAVQRALLSNLTNGEIRATLEKEKPGYYGHHYLEAYIGGRWIKINNDSTVGTGILNVGGTILSCKSDAYFDIADTPVSDIWRRGFPRPVPYRLVSLSDRYGNHYDPARLPKNKATVFGVSLDGMEGAYLFGGREYCTANAWRFPLIVRKMASVNYFEPPILERRCIILVSGEYRYEQLPEAIRNVITAERYGALENDIPAVIRLGKAVLVFLRTGAS